jgi:hypothetical protein
MTFATVENSPIALPILALIPHDSRETARRTSGTIVAQNVLEENLRW